MSLCYSSRWPHTYTLNATSSKKQQPRHACLSEAKVSHSQRIWAEVSSSAPRLPHNGLSLSLRRRRCLLRVLCPVRRPVIAVDCVLLKDRNLALALRQVPEVSPQACLWASPRPCHLTQCWLINQRLILLRISHLETPELALVQETPE